MTIAACAGLFILLCWLVPDFGRSVLRLAMYLLWIAVFVLLLLVQNNMLTHDIKARVSIETQMDGKT